MITVRQGCSRSIFVWFPLAVVVLLGLLASPARAQFGMGMGGGDPMEMSIAREAVDRYAEILGFDDVQRETALMLHREYLDSYKQASDALTDAMRKLQEEAGRSRDWEAMMKPMGKIMLGWMDRSAELESQFLSDLRMLAIEPAQEEAFVRVERAHRREQVGVWGQMVTVSGGTINLFDVAQSVEVDGNGDARQALLSYEAEIDPIYERTIDRVSDFTRQQLKQMQEGFEWDEEAMTRMQEAMTDLSDLGKQAKSINARYARQIMQLLPAERQAAWDREVKERTWPTVYRKSKVERQMEAAGKLEDLSSTQRESLDAMRQSYEREASPINQRWADAVDKQAENNEGNWWGWGQDNSEIEAIQEERNELDDRFVERVRAILTPAQLEAMPEAGESGFDADAVLRQFGGG